MVMRLTPGWKEYLIDWINNNILLLLLLLAYIWSLGPEARSETAVSMTVLEVHVVQDKAELSSCRVKGSVVLLGLYIGLGTWQVIEQVTDSLHSTVLLYRMTYWGSWMLTERLLCRGVTGLSLVRQSHQRFWSWNSRTRTQSSPLPVLSNFYLRMKYCWFSITVNIRLFSSNLRSKRGIYQIWVWPWDPAEL